jgi:hypothetical protein
LGQYIKPEEINFNMSYEGIDPFSLYELVPQPRYLVIENYDEDLNAYETHSIGKKPKKRPKGLTLTKGGDQDEEASIMDETQSVSSIQLVREMPDPMGERRNKYNCPCIEQRDSLYSKLPNRHEQLFAFGK